MVGAILADEAKPLPVDLRAFLEQGLAEGHGAVYVSMGTAARLTQQEMHSLSEALSALPNPILWKVSAVQLPSKLMPVLSTCLPLYTLPLAGIHSHTCSSSDGGVSHVVVPCSIIVMNVSEPAGNLLALYSRLVN